MALHLNASISYFAPFSLDDPHLQRLRQEKLSIPLLTMGADHTEMSQHVEPYATHAHSVIIVDSGHCLPEEPPQEVVQHLLSCFSEERDFDSWFEYMRRKARKLMNKGQNMQAIAITAFGGPDRLTLMELPVPVCGPDQVVIKIQAAGVGMWDVKVRQGRVRLEGQQFPLILGWESAGTIEQVGARVTGLSVGTQVMCATYQVGIGHYAQYVAVPADLVAPAPASLDALHAAALPVNGLTAYQAIYDQLKLQKGETLLITGAAGGTGTLAVQLAARVGAHVIVTANSRNHPYLQKLGASELIDYAQTDFADAIHAAHPKGIDAVLDSVGGETAAKSLNVVRDGGRLVTIVDLEQVRPTRHIDTHLLYFRPDGQQLAELTKLVDTGQLTVHLDQIVPLAKAREAHERLETRHHQGKIVLSV